MAAATTTATTTMNFAEHFWGEKNNGYDVLYHNMKLGHVACQDLIEYLKESARVEENYNKSLGKLAVKVGGCACVRVRERRKEGGCL